MKKIKTYILFLLCLIIPIGVSAHNVNTGNVTKTDGETDIPIMVQATEDIPVNTQISVSSCTKDNSNVSCTVSRDNISGITSGGALMTAQASGSEFQVATVIIKNSDSTQNSGTFSITVTVGNSDKKTATFQFSVNGARTKSTNAALKTLTSSQGTIAPAFGSDTTDYTIYNLKDTINSVTLTYTCDNCGLSAENYGSLSISKGTSNVKVANLAKGENNITLNVTSEDGTQTKAYNFTIIRGETEYDSSKLSEISIGEYKLSPTFKESTLEYSVSVPYSVKDLDDILSITQKDENATVEVEGDKKLEVGENTVTITVTSVNEDSTTTYTITVTRLESDDIILVSYKNGKITFKDADGKKQTLTEAKFKKQYPDVWEDIEDGKYKFDEDGNLITDEEDTSKNGSNKTIIIVIVVIIAIIIIGVTGFLLFRKKDPAKEKAKQEKKIKKKAEKAARKAELEKMEKEYYDEYYKEYDEDDEDEESSKSNKDDKKLKDDESKLKDQDDEITDDDKLNKDEAKALLEDDYIFPYDEEDEEEIEKPKRRHNEDDVVDVDSALEDLMYTKTYDFSEELKDVKDLDDEYEEEDE